MSEPGDVTFAATLPELSFTVTAIHDAKATLAGTFPPLELVAEARYQSYAVRPVTGQSATRWRHAASHDAGAEDRREGCIS